VLLDPASRRPRIADDEQSGNRDRIPPALASDVQREALLAVECH
jgi:hypothetical protein